MASDSWRDDIAALTDAQIVQELRNAGVAFGCAIKHTRSSYVPEVQAIALALKAAPLDLDVQLFSDSKSALHAISEHGTRSLRRRFRSEARPWLELITEIQKRRQLCGSLTTLEHVAAHTGQADHRSG